MEAQVSVMDHPSLVPETKPGEANRSMEAQVSVMDHPSLVPETKPGEAAPQKDQMESQQTRTEPMSCSTSEQSLAKPASPRIEPASPGDRLLIQKYPTADELVSKARAPVKREYLRPAPVRSLSDSGSAPLNDAAVAKVSVEKKSRRQLKRERQQERKSVLNICAAVARAGNAKACPYDGTCRYSHDLEAFLAQKPLDLPGKCPFLHLTEPCPYGLACLFAGTHKEQSCPKEEMVINDVGHETNGLNKELQKLIWKNAITFPAADTQLKALGILGKGKPRPSKIPEEEHATSNQGCKDDSCVYTKAEIKDIHSGAIAAKNEFLGSSSEEHCLKEEAMQNVDIPPPKKLRTVAHGNDLEEISAGHIANGDFQHKTNNMDNGIKSETKKVFAEGDMHISIGDKDGKMNLREKKLIDFRGKLYLAPLTTVGNLPFRRLCKLLGADITCGEMAMCVNLLQGQASEWALLRRHSSEDLFGVQICGTYPDTVAHTVELIERECTVDFIDINMGCPIDIVVNKGAGSFLLTKPTRMQNVIKAAAATMEKPVTVKVRTGYFEGRNCVHSLISDISKSGAAAITIHGRTRQQRYSKLADWDYIYECARQAPDDLQVVGNGDVFSFTDWNEHLRNGLNLSTNMIARAALIKPWIFTEIKEQRHWDISSMERFDILKEFVRFGLQHWGSDKKGVETTRHFLLEWLSYTCRYIPVGLLDVVPQRMNWRPPSYFGRNDLETLMVSDSAADWVRLSEMMLGPVPAGFTFTPKHKSNAYDRAENG